MFTWKFSVKFQNFSSVGGGGPAPNPQTMFPNFYFEPPPHPQAKSLATLLIAMTEFKQSKIVPIFPVLMSIKMAFMNLIFEMIRFYLTFKYIY